MPANLSKQKVSDTFRQLLHVDGGADSTVKPVVTAEGVGTALALSTTQVEIKSLLLPDAPLGLEHGGTGERTKEGARAALGLLPVYGGFVATSDQHVITPMAATPVQFTDPMISSGLGLDANTRITVAQEGAYAIEASVLATSMGGGSHHAYLWLATDEGVVPGSLVTAMIDHDHRVPLRLTALRQLTPDNWLSLMWTASHQVVQLAMQAVSGLPVGAVSARVAVVRVG